MSDHHSDRVGLENSDDLSEFGDVDQDDPNEVSRKWYECHESFMRDNYDYRKDEQLFPPGAQKQAEKYIKENKFDGNLPPDYKEKIKTWLEAYQEQKTQIERDIRKNKKCRLSHKTFCYIMINHDETELSKILKGYYKDRFVNVSCSLREIHVYSHFVKNCNFESQPSICFDYEIYKEQLAELIDAWVTYLSTERFQNLGKNIKVEYNNEMLRNIKSAIYYIDWSYDYNQNKIPYDHDPISIDVEGPNKKMFEAMFKHMPQGNGAIEVINGKRYVAVDAVMHKTHYYSLMKKMQEKRESVFNSRMRDFKDMLYIFDINKRNLWYLIMNDHELSDLPFSLTCQHCVFTYLITHGLDSSAIGRRRWYEFLTRGIYDPRLLIIIYRFAEDYRESNFELRIDGLD